MGVGHYLEPLVVVILLFGGAWINRTTYTLFDQRKGRRSGRKSVATYKDSSFESQRSDTLSAGSKEALLDSDSSRSSSPGSLTPPDEPWRERKIAIFGWKATVISPNTAVFRDRLLSRLLRKFPFLAECWYWALVYWVCTRRLTLRSTKLMSVLEDISIG